MRGSRTLIVQQVTVGAERVSALVRIVEGHPLRSSSVPGLAEDVLLMLPGLVRHRCECGSARGIVAELADTELPHLLEHVALELMALAGSPRSLRGETTWDFTADGHGVFRVALEYDDDLVALGALREAATVVNALVEGDDGAVDVVAAAARLARVRRG
jgi:cyanophycin synthetase